MWGISDCLKGWNGLAPIKHLDDMCHMAVCHQSPDQTCKSLMAQEVVPAFFINGPTSPLGTSTKCLGRKAVEKV